MPGVSHCDVAAGIVFGYGNAYVEFGSYPPSESEPELNPYAREA